MPGFATIDRHQERKSEAGSGAAIFDKLGLNQWMYQICGTPFGPQIDNYATYSKERMVISVHRIYTIRNWSGANVVSKTSLTAELLSKTTSEACTHTTGRSTTCTTLNSQISRI